MAPDSFSTRKSRQEGRGTCSEPLPFCPRFDCSRDPRVMKLNDVIQPATGQGRGGVCGRHFLDCCLNSWLELEGFNIHRKLVSAGTKGCQDVAGSQRPHLPSPPAPLPSSKTGAHQDEEGHPEPASWTLEVGRGRCPMGQESHSFMPLSPPLFNSIRV